MIETLRKVEIKENTHNLINGLYKNKQTNQPIADVTLCDKRLLQLGLRRKQRCLLSSFIQHFMRGFSIRQIKEVSKVPI